MALMPQQKNRFSWWNTEVADFWLQHVRPHWSLSRAYALVKARKKVAADAVAIELQPNRHVPLCHPGQHMSVVVTIDGVRHKRYYSPTQLANGNLLITVKRVEGGRVSEWIHDVLTSGQTVELGEPTGAFHQLDKTKPLLLLAAGSGITPMYSLLTHLLADSLHQAPVALHYWAAKREQLCFVDELRAWAETAKNFSFVPYLTQEATLLEGEQQGRFQAQEFIHGQDGLAEAQVLVCGPFGFVQSTQELQPHVAAWHSETHQEAQAKDALGTHSVTLVKSGKTVAVAANKTLLEGLEEAGIEVPFGCRRGICNTCSCQRLEGTTEHLVSNNTASGDGVVQLCVNQAVSDIHLNL